MAKESQKKIREKNRTEINNGSELIEKLKQESDRGVALLVGSALDIYLRDLLSAFFIDNVDIVDSLLGTEKNPDVPLGSFAAKIKAAFCLGLLTEAQYHDLNRIRGIRNHFAHQLYGHLEEEPIRESCLQMEVVGLRPDDQSWSSRRILLTTYILLMANIREATTNVQKQRCVIPKDVFEMRRESRISLNK